MYSLTIVKRNGHVEGRIAYCLRILTDRENVVSRTYWNAAERKIMP